MSDKPRVTQPGVTKRAPRSSGLSGDEVKTRLREKGETLKGWAEKNGFAYSAVSQVVRGINRGTFGVGHRIATKLGMK